MNLSSKNIFLFPFSIDDDSIAEIGVTTHNLPAVFNEKRGESILYFNFNHPANNMESAVLELVKN